MSTLVAEATATPTPTPTPLPPGPRTPRLWQTLRFALWPYATAGTVDIVASPAPARFVRS